MRIILESEGNTKRQLAAAEWALRDGIKDGHHWGFLIDGEGFGVKANKTSIRVYPPPPPLTPHNGE